MKIKINEGNVGHHYIDGNTVYGDSNFVNFSQGIIPGSKLKHLGFGEFYLDCPDGKIQFQRGGKTFSGQVGRSHKVYDDANGKLVKQLVAGMIKKGKSELVKEDKLRLAIRNEIKKLTEASHIDMMYIFKALKSYQKSRRTPHDLTRVTDSIAHDMMYKDDKRQIEKLRDHIRFSLGAEDDDEWSSYTDSELKGIAKEIYYKQY